MSPSWKRRRAKLKTKRMPENKPFEGKDLPGDNDPFWGKDAATEKVKVPDVKAAKHHKLKMQGGYFICTSCPYEHTVPLNPKKYELDREGNVVRKK